MADLRADLTELRLESSLVDGRADLTADRMVGKKAE